MPKLKDRECASCGSVLKNTASRAVVCLPCQKKQKKESDTSAEIKMLAEWNYTLVSGPNYDKFNHRVYRLITPCCGSEYEVVFNNLRKQVNNAKEKGLRPPCGTCGPKHRLTKALEKYVEKYGVDYDLDAFNDYRKKVRGLSEVTYRRNKHLINPQDLPRGHHEYHLDHIVPIIECFKNGWAPEKAADASNLQMLWCKSNLAKGSS